MGKEKVGLLILAAISRELKYIIRDLSAVKTSEMGPFPVLSAVASPGRVILAQTGIGVRSAGAAMEYLLSTFRPDLILSVGYGGALYKRASAGELLLASRFIFIPGRDDVPQGLLSLKDHPPILSSEYPVYADRLSAIVPLREGSVVTLERLMSKSEVMKHIPEGLLSPVCDMETYMQAKLSAEEEIPFLAARSITDTAEEEIAPELLELTDGSGGVRPSSIPKVLLRKPELFWDMIRLGRNSEKASRSLSTLVKALFSILQV